MDTKTESELPEGVHPSELVTGDDLRGEQIWVKPEQVEELRTTIYEVRPDYLQQRDDAIVVVLYDGGLRVCELSSLNVGDLSLGERTITLSPGQQKSYPTGGEPSRASITLSADSTRTLRSYLNNRWKDTKALFPSRESSRIGEQGIRDLVACLAEEAGIYPYVGGGGRRTIPDELHPHAFRHSVAYRMIRREGKQLDDVKRRLRHQSILTTERAYSHFDAV